MAFDLKSYQREYRLRNKEKLSAYQLEWRRNNENKLKEYKSKRYQENRVQILSAQAADRAANPEKYSANKAARRAKNLEKIRAQERESKNRNADSRRKSMAAYRRRARAGNPIVAIKDRLRARIGLAFRQGGYTKKSSLSEIIGCTYEQLIIHLESQFTEGMNWSNRGEWHIDHKKPLATAKSGDDLVSLCHYTNLQPLWSKDNMSKGAKLMDAA